MSVEIFKLEQQILNCWHITNDIETVTKWFVDDPVWEGMDPKLCDAIMNKYFAIQELYELKFDKMWHTFEKVCEEYHEYRQLSGVERERQLEELFSDEDNT